MSWCACGHRYSPLPPSPAPSHASLLSLPFPRILPPRSASCELLRPLPRTCIVQSIFVRTRVRSAKARVHALLEGAAEGALRAANGGVRGREMATAMNIVIFCSNNNIYDVKYARTRAHDLLVCAASQPPYAGFCIERSVGSMVTAGLLSSCYPIIFSHPWPWADGSNRPSDSGGGGDVGARTQYGQGNWGVGEEEDWFWGPRREPRRAGFSGGSWHTSY